MFISWLDPKYWRIFACPTGSTCAHYSLAGPHFRLSSRQHTTNYNTPVLMVYKVLTIFQPATVTLALLHKPLWAFSTAAIHFSPSECARSEGVEGCGGLQFTLVNMMEDQLPDFQKTDLNVCLRRFGIHLQLL